MSKKAVYNNKGLAIYITGKDFEMWLRRFHILIPVYIGKDETSVGAVSVELSAPARQELVHALKQEQKAVEKVRDIFKRRHPDYRTYKQRK